MKRRGWYTGVRYYHMELNCYVGGLVFIHAVVFFLRHRGCIVYLTLMHQQPRYNVLLRNWLLCYLVSGLVNRITTCVTYKYVTSSITKFVNFRKFDILILVCLVLILNFLVYCLIFSYLLNILIVGYWVICKLFNDVISSAKITIAKYMYSLGQ
jgi:hypothetical protein